MVGNSLASPLLYLKPSDTVTVALASAALSTSFSNSATSKVTSLAWPPSLSAKKWVVRASDVTVDLSEEQKKTWERCRDALSVFNFSNEEEDKILAKAFGQIHSPYWGEERKKEVPTYEALSETLDYLRSLTLSDEDLCKLLKKFPEVLGCELEDEVKNNVKVLEKDWGIKGKSLRNLLHRNPKVLGYNIDCKGDCMAQCTRCWVRF
ncbi:uncharacterized protein LOC115755515 [Rhodamnia argentea]|uniref:Uncharacterized protein LOC115755515 n=1 Tax=Rhodamnia argentea TaxID=178133 RepID=A0A8B8QWW7_9MYRT|nr:uncharacterized protein LOC115755515 [Rhodamnia argentea]XP_048130738.1 uncharacterized protein LOC115755515 [Rhodamnia argentea]